MGQSGHHVLARFAKGYRVMNSFSAEWLTLRENADGRARNAGLEAKVKSLLKSNDRECMIVDLGAGRGSNFRYLAPILGGAQSWQLIDADEELLKVAIPAIGEWAEVQGWPIRQGDHQIEIDTPNGRWTAATELADLEQNLDDLKLDNVDLITASALLDLVSKSWIERLAGRVPRSHPPYLFTLSYNGDLVFDPTDADDGWVSSLLNQHQETNKGFGAALGPAAIMYVREAMEKRGYVAVTGESPWQLESRTHAGDADLQRVLLNDWVTSLTEWQPRHGLRLQSWLNRRITLLESGFATLRIGHEDLLCWADGDTGLSH